MPVPPIPSRTRATRKPLVYGLLRRWYEPDLAGLDYFEREHLRSLGYERWLRRKRLTADMVGDLLLYEIEVHRYVAANIALNGREERERIAAILHGRADAITADERACLAAIEALDQRAAERPVQRIRGYTSRGKAIYEPEHPDTRQEWNEIRTNYRSVIDETLPHLFGSIDSGKRQRLGNARRAPVLHLGERAHELTYVRRLRHELGPRFLAPGASRPHRATCVRKWKQQALARAARDEVAHRALLDHNRQVREAHRRDSQAYGNRGAFLIV